MATLNIARDGAAASYAAAVQIPEGVLAGHLDLDGFGTAGCPALPAREDGCMVWRFVACRCSASSVSPSRQVRVTGSS